MSSIDEKKQQNELACFETAVSLAQQRGGKTLEILNYLNGTPVPRARADKPDLVRVCARGKKNPRNVLVGMEHFRVDQRSHQKKDGRISQGAQITTHALEAYKKGHEEMEQAGEASEQSRISLLNEVTKLAQENIRNPFSSLLEDFAFHLNRHLSKAAVYRENLQNIAGEMPIELAFLIEIHAYLPPLFLNEGKNITMNPSGRLVMFQELVNELAKISSKTVNYFVLVFNGSGATQFTDVIAFRSGNIKNHLRQQGISVYRYAGNDILGESAYQALRVQWEESLSGDYRVLTDFSGVDRKETLRSFGHALRYAFSLKERGIPFAATSEVQSSLDAAFPYIDGFTELEGIIQPHYKKGTDLKLISARYDSAIENYKRMGSNDETTGAN